MIDIELIRHNPDDVQRRAATKGYQGSIAEVQQLDEQRRRLQTELDQLRRQRHALTIAEAKARGAELKEQIKAHEAAHQVIDEKLTTELLLIPNLPTDDTPIGPDESANVVRQEIGERPQFAFQPKPHWELGHDLNLIDNARAAKVSGARFTYLKGALARLQFGLIQYALSVLTDVEQLQQIATDANLNVNIAPFIPVVPPVMIKPDVFQKMGRLEPKEERYYIPSDDTYLVGSAEHTLGAMHMDETFAESELPLRYIGYSTAFRREAGTYGKDTKGILRLHQFDKLEIESFTLAEDSLTEQNFIVAIQTYLMRSLGLPIRIVAISTGDMGGPDARQIDIETWLPGQATYRETHTADLMTDYQARRLNIRVKRAAGTALVHMNDATAFAIGRTLIAIMENYQAADGTITIPDALVPFVGFGRIELSNEKHKAQSEESRSKL